LNLALFLARLFGLRQDKRAAPINMLAVEGGATPLDLQILTLMRFSSSSSTKTHKREILDLEHEDSESCGWT
jgi:hypothetical protein